MSRPSISVAASPAPRGSMSVNVGAGSPSASRQMVQFALNGGQPTTAQQGLPSVTGSPTTPNHAAVQQQQQLHVGGGTMSTPPFHPRNAAPSASPSAAQSRVSSAHAGGGPRLPRGSISPNPNGTTPTATPMHKRNQSSRARGEGSTPVPSPKNGGAARSGGGSFSVAPLSAPPPSHSPAPLAILSSRSPATAALGASSGAGGAGAKRTGSPIRRDSRSVVSMSATATTAREIKPLAPGALVQRQSPPQVQPPWVDPASTPLVVLCSINGAFVATLDVTTRAEGDRKPLAGMCALETNAKGMALTGAQDGWRLWNPHAHLSEEEKLKRRVAHADAVMAGKLQQEQQPAHGSGRGGGGPGGAAGSTSSLGGASLNKYDSNGVLIEDEFDRARVLASVSHQGQMHQSRQSMTFAPAAAAALTVAALTAAAAGSAASASGAGARSGAKAGGPVAAAAAASAPASSVSPPPGPAGPPLTAACWLHDGRLVTTDNAGMLRLFADEAHRFRQLAEQDLSVAGEGGGSGTAGGGADHPSSHHHQQQHHRYLPSGFVGNLDNLVTLLLPLEDGRLLTAQEAELSLYDEVLQVSPNAPAFRLDKTHLYTTSESVKALPGQSGSSASASSLLASTSGGAIHGGSGGGSGTGSSAGGGGDGGSGGAGGSAAAGSARDATIKCMLSLPHLGARGLLVTGHADRTIQVLDLHSFTLRSTLHGHVSSVTCLAELNDGRVASGAADFNVKVWNVESQRCDITLRGHTAPILSLTPTWHANQLLSSAADGTLRLWNLSTGSCDAVWNLGEHVSHMRLLPVPPTSREEPESSDKDTDSELAAIAQIIRAERERERDKDWESPTLSGLAGPGAGGSGKVGAGAGAGTNIADSPPGAMAPLPAGAFSHLELVAPHSLLDEADDPSARERRVVAAAVAAAAAAASNGQQLQLARSERSYTSRVAPVDGSLFARSARPPAVADLAQSISEKDSLIRAQAAPHYAVPAPSRSVAAPVPLHYHSPSKTSAAAGAGVYEDDFELPPDSNAPSANASARITASSVAASPASATAPVTAAAAAASPSTRNLSPSRAALAVTLSAVNSAVSPMRVFDRSSAVERSQRAAEVSSSHSPERNVASYDGDGGAPVSPSRRLPASLFAASLIEFPPANVLATSDPSRARLPRAAPFIDDLAEYSPQQLTHIIHEQHRRARHEANAGMRGGGGGSSSLLKPRRDFSVLAGETDRSGNSPPRVSTWLDPTTLASVAARGGVDGAEEKECLSPASLRDRALQQSLSAARLHRRSGRRDQQQDTDPIAEEHEGEDDEDAKRRKRLEKQRRQAAVNSMLERVAGVKPSRSSSATAEAAAASGAKVHVLARGRPKTQGDTGDDGSNVFLTSVDAEMDAEEHAADASADEAKSASPSPVRGRSPNRKSAPQYPSVDSFLPKDAAAPAEQSAVNHAGASKSSLARSRSEARYMVGGVALAPPPAKGVPFNRALYGHLVGAKPNPATGGLIFPSSSSGKAGLGLGLSAYTREEHHPALARTQALAQVSGGLGRSASLPALTHPAAGLLGPSKLAFALAKPVGKKTKAFVQRMQKDLEQRAERERERALSPSSHAAADGSAEDETNALAKTAPAAVTFVPVSDPNVPVLQRVAANAAARAEAQAARTAAREAAKRAERTAAEQAYARRVAEQRAAAKAASDDEDDETKKRKQRKAMSFSHRLADQIQQRLREAKQGEKASYLANQDNDEGAHGANKQTKQAVATADDADTAKATATDIAAADKAAAGAAPGANAS